MSSGCAGAGPEEKALVHHPCVPWDLGRVRLQREEGRSGQEAQLGSGLRPVTAQGDTRWCGGRSGHVQAEVAMKHTDGVARAQAEQVSEVVSGCVGSRDPALQWAGSEPKTPLCAPHTPAGPLGVTAGLMALRHRWRFSLGVNSPR